MAMIKCPECGNQLSTKAAACVRCGLPVSEIFICPECGMAAFKDNITYCPECGYILDKKEDKEQGNNKNQNPELTEKQRDLEYMRFGEKVISAVLGQYALNGVGVICGSGLEILDKVKVNAARKAFHIPEEEKVFLIVSGNIMGGINERSKGFALTSRGLYFRDDDKKEGMFYLHKLVNLKIGTSMSFLKLGSFEFNISDTRKIKNLFLDLQCEVENYL